MFALGAGPGYHLRLAPGSSYLMSALSAGPGYHLRLAPGSPYLKSAFGSAPGWVLAGVLAGSRDSLLLGLPWAQPLP
jgi:hypothetical protein